MFRSVYSPLIETMFLPPISFWRKAKRLLQNNLSYHLEHYSFAFPPGAESIEVSSCHSTVGLLLQPLFRAGEFIMRKHHIMGSSSPVLSDVGQWVSGSRVRRELGTSQLKSLLSCETHYTNLDLLASIVVRRKGDRETYLKLPQTLGWNMLGVKQ